MRGTVSRRSRPGLNTDLCAPPGKARIEFVYGVRVTVCHAVAPQNVTRFPNFEAYRCSAAWLSRLLELAAGLAALAAPAHA